MNHDAHRRQQGKTHDRFPARRQAQLVAGVNHHRHGGGGIDEAAQVHLPEGNHEPGVHRQEQHEIEFARADELGKLSAVGQKNGRENLLNKMARAQQHHHLPLRPGANPIGMRVDDREERQLQREPEHLHDDPKEEVRFETHLAHDRVLPKRAVDFQISFQCHVP